MSKCIYLTCVLSCTLAMNATILSAQTAPALPAVQTTAMIGLAEGQTAQLNLLNPGIVAPATGVICSAAVSFVDANGAVLKTKYLSIPPGKSMAFDVSDIELAITYGARREIRALIAMPAATPVATSSAAVPGCKLIPTLEIFDSATGRTLVTLGHVETIPSVVAAN
jgi:hypothetical protein